MGEHDHSQEKGNSEGNLPTSATDPGKHLCVQESNPVQLTTTAGLTGGKVPFKLSGWYCLFTMMSCAERGTAMTEMQK